jgi:hypothetical protein
MPGRSSRSSFLSRSSSKPSAPTQSSNVPAVQHSVKVEQPGFFSNIMQGFGLGTGQAIAHNIFRSDPIVKHVSVPTTNAVPTLVSEASQPKAYVQCMKEYDNKELCEQYLENK